MKYSSFFLKKRSHDYIIAWHINTVTDKLACIIFPFIYSVSFSQCELRVLKNNQFVKPSIVILQMICIHTNLQSKSRSPQYTLCL